MYFNIFTGKAPLDALKEKIAPARSNTAAIKAVMKTDRQKLLDRISDKGDKFIPIIYLSMRLTIFFIFCNLYVLAQSLRIEPPTWWIGMKNSKLQLLVQGENVSAKNVFISKPGVKLIKTTKGDSPNYLFIDLDISSSASPGNIKIAIGDQIIQYPLEARIKGSASRTGFNNADIIYLITPDRFANGDPGNDSITGMKEGPNRSFRGGRHGGDIKGIDDRLDYIKDMGFTTLWCMPLLENNLATYTYHGYAISDYYKIDPRYGNNESFKALCIKAKNMGIKSIMDVVLNHCGSGHWWMNDMPFKDWINYGGNYVNTNHRREANQDIHASSYDRELMQAGWFVPTMPDLNSRNPYMATYLIQNTIWWIEYAQLAGLRIDTYPYVDKTFSSTWSRAILNEYPNLNMVGEEWSYNPVITSYWQKGQKNKDGYTSSLNSVFDFPLQTAIVQALNEKEAFNDGLIKIYQTLANDYVYANSDNLMTMTDNHDMSRIYTQLKENFNHWKQAMVLLLTTRGIPQIYYGTEILMTNPKSDDHGEIRADMPGGWLGDGKNAFTGTNLSSRELEAQSFLKKLCNLRIQSPALQKGKLIHFAADRGVYVYFRVLGAERYIIIINKNEKSVQVDRSKYIEILPANVLSFKNAITGDTETDLMVEGEGFKVLKF